MNETNIKRVEQMTAVTVQHHDGHLLIPSEMRPKLARKKNGSWTAYVEGWTGAREFDSTCFHLYPLLDKNQREIKVGTHGEAPETQVWYVLDTSTRRATKTSGEFVEEVCLVTKNGSDSLYPANLPLPEYLKEGDQNQSVLVTRRYLRTARTNDEGRVVYEEG